MVGALRTALAGQAVALVALVATQAEPAWARVGLQVACGAEALGFGVGAVWAGVGLRWGEALRGVLSIVLWLLAVRHLGLVLDPLGVGAWRTSPLVWSAAVGVWGLGVLGGRRWDGAVRGPWVPWGIAVMGLGGLNTLMMAVRRAAM